MLGMQGFSYIDLDLLSADHDLGAARLTENPLAGEWDPELVPVVDGVRIPMIIGVATLDARTPRDGAAVAVSGYPFAINSLVTNSGCIASSFFPTFNDDPIPDAPEPPEGVGEIHREEILTPGDKPAIRYLADLEVNGGNSGGPVYLTETGHVIGVCVATRSALVRRGGQPVRLGDEYLTYSSGLTVVFRRSTSTAC